MAISFEAQYQDQGFASQRKYPNESFLAFLGSNYFSLNRVQRAETKILELGCGSGANLWAVAREGFDAYGIDFAATGIALCEEMMAFWSVKAELVQGDMTSLPYASEDFDLVFDVVSMQHLTLEQHRKAFQEAFRVLKPGGKFFSYHLGDNSVSYLKSTSAKIDSCTIENIDEGLPLQNNGQTCFLSTDKAIAMLQETEFTAINIEKITRTYLNQSQQLEYLVISATK